MSEEKKVKKIKIVISGPFAAGKTEFIKTVSEIEPITTEKKISHSEEREKKATTTVAMDFGKIKIDDEHELYLFGTPGQHLGGRRHSRLRDFREKQGRR